ncbi:hypothetical protein B0A67_11990 [Flavobacterium aquidurense]|jgi:transcriptional regulator with XRE-family HTH domain|uniref:helix-turn-helix domain-containing protein n=1 Tax=Flavobacterium aquidurense TaxID=362413 RepID=UPI000921480F|nr:helix-turn-helix transcriptional regulator [Flavobacterium aquidurense]OXA71510.1 hypothetical protein B0A67_11990 [Flavobacterium aquidurense]SHG96699.1 Helix-turn-helix [Flavobacterium frigidimaris]
MIIEIIISELDFYIIEKIREVRLKANPSIDQVELAQRLGLSEGYIGRIENLKVNAKYNIRLLARIAKALNIGSYQELLPTSILPNDMVRIRLQLLEIPSRKHKTENNKEVVKRLKEISKTPLTDEEYEFLKSNKKEDKEKVKYLTIIN